MGIAFTRSNFHVGTATMAGDLRNERPEARTFARRTGANGGHGKNRKGGPVAIEVAGLGHSVPELKSATDRVAVARKNLRRLRT